jgi:membrane protein implicated in regulation of membrane protease activity
VLTTNPLFILAFKSSFDGVAFAGYRKFFLFCFSPILSFLPVHYSHYFLLSYTVVVIVFEVFIVILALILNPSAKKRRRETEEQLGVEQHSTIQSEATIAANDPTALSPGKGKEGGLEGEGETKRINPEVIPHEGERV